MRKDWGTITKDELAALAKEHSDSMIADKFGISIGKVRYKRQKFGITMRDRMLKEMLNVIMQQETTEASFLKNLLLNRANINMLAKAITQYAFRSGPVEKMHCENKLTDEDMKILNKNMVNKMAGLLQKAFDGEWMQINAVFSFYAVLSSSWDDAEPDTSDFDISIEI